MNGKYEKLVTMFAVLASLTVGTARAELIAYWGFDDSTGNIARDEVGKNHGVLHGSPTWVNGYFDGALKFDGIDDYVSITHDPIFNISDAITIGVWIKVDTFNKEWQAIVTKGDSAWRISRDRNIDAIEFGANISDSLWLVRGRVSVDDGNWHHVAGVYDGSKAYLYVDGELDHSIKTTKRISHNNRDVYIGENAEKEKRKWNGLIDDVIIFNHALSQTEIKQLYRLGGKLFISELVVLSGTVRDAEVILKEQRPKDAIVFIETQIKNYNRWKEKNPIDPGLSYEVPLSDLYFLLARAKEVGSAPTNAVIEAYKKLALLSLRTPNYVPALYWLFNNVPSGDYIDVVKKSLRKSKNAFDYMHLIAIDFKSTEDWAAFELFLDAVFSEVNDTNSFAKAIAGGLENNSVWFTNYSRYCRSKPGLTQYVIETYEKCAEENIERNEFLEAAEIYRDIVNQCDANQDKTLYELKICECMFHSGQYTSAISELNSFIKNNKATNRLLVKQAILLKGRAYLQLGKIDNATDTFLESMIHYPETKQAAEANFFIGYCNMLQGKLEEAKETFGFVVKDYPQSSYASKARLCLRRIERMTE